MSLDAWSWVFVDVLCELWQKYAAVCGSWCNGNGWRIVSCCLSFDVSMKVQEVWCRDSVLGETASWIKSYDILKMVL